VHYSFFDFEGRTLMRVMQLVGTILLAVLVSANAAQASLRITEWMYSGSNGEFVEFTNVGVSPVNLTGWYYTDSDQNPFDIDLSDLGTIQPGESFILTETAEFIFRAAWGLDGSVKIKGGNTDSNMGRNDEVNIYHGSLIDRLTYGDQTFAGSIRTQNRSGNPLSIGAIGANDVYQWGLASASGTDAYGSWTSSGGDRGNPGFFYLASSLPLVPEPTSLALLLLGASAAGAVRRRRS
jgi:hypothetical protein